MNITRNIIFAAILALNVTYVPMQAANETPDENRETDIFNSHNNLTALTEFLKQGALATIKALGLPDAESDEMVREAQQAAEKRVQGLFPDLKSDDPDSPEQSLLDLVPLHLPMRNLLKHPAAKISTFFANIASTKPHSLQLIKSTINTYPDLLEIAPFAEKDCPYTFAIEHAIKHLATGDADLIELSMQKIKFFNEKNASPFKKNDAGNNAISLAKTNKPISAIVISRLKIDQLNKVERQFSQDATAAPLLQAIQERKNLLETEQNANIAAQKAIKDANKAREIANREKKENTELILSKISQAAERAKQTRIITLERQLALVKQQAQKLHTEFTLAQDKEREQAASLDQERDEQKKKIELEKTEKIRAKKAAKKQAKQEQAAMLAKASEEQEKILPEVLLRPVTPTLIVSEPSVNLENNSEHTPASHLHQVSQQDRIELGIASNPSLESLRSATPCSVISETLSASASSDSDRAPAPRQRRVPSPSIENDNTQSIKSDDKSDKSDKYDAQLQELAKQNRELMDKLTKLEAEKNRTAQEAEDYEAEDAAPDAQQFATFNTQPQFAQQAMVAPAGLMPYPNHPGYWYDPQTGNTFMVAYTYPQYGYGYPPAAAQMGHQFGYAVPAAAPVQPQLPASPYLLAPAQYYPTQSN